MSWEKRPIGSLCEVTSSKRIFYSEYVERGVPFYRSKEIIEKAQGQDISEPLFISEEKYERIKEHFGTPAVGDMLLTSVGTIGIAYIVKDNDRFYFKDGNLTWFRHFGEELLPKYLYYWISSSEGLSILNNSTIGSSQKALTINALKSIKIPLPPVKIQKRIVDLLSAYDVLIENNQKQIKLLEEAAQRLYKEWFVDLRFPGHENTPIIDGVPQGWKNGTLGDVALFKRGKTITKDQTCVGDIPVVAGGLEPAYYHNQSNTSSPVITVSGSGANAGYTRMYHTNIWASDCSFVDKKSTRNLYFTFCILKDKKSDIDVLKKGAAQPHVYAKDINALEIVVPETDILARFENTVSPYFEKEKILLEQIELSKQARNRLLPKLMSGEIVV